jgi:hypothetical protein
MFGSYTEVRQGAYIRGKCIVGDRCVWDIPRNENKRHAERAKAGHFAYIATAFWGIRPI